MVELPTGTVTFLFSGIEGSTRLLREHQDGYARVLSEHRSALRTAFAAYGGIEIGTEGDSFSSHLLAPQMHWPQQWDGQRALAGGPVRVRMGLHSGEPLHYHANITLWR